MKFEGRRRSKTRLNLVPLINIIFLLLIFFMFAGSIEPPSPFAVELPGSVNAEPPVEPLYENLILHIGSEGQLALNGQSMTWDELSAQLSFRMNAPEPDQKDIAARIDIDARAPTGRLADVMRILKYAGVQSVLLSTRAE